MDRCKVVGLATRDDLRRVTGVRLVRQADGSTKEALTANLVVDATGRTSRTPGWLEALGYPRPVEHKVLIRVGYASCQLRLHPPALGGDKFVIIGPRPDRPAGMALFAIENDRWILSLFGYRDRPSVDVDGFWSFAAKVAPPDVFAAIRNAELLDRIVAHRMNSS
ncbi:MAG: hypothetical protein M3186_07325, partial [Actinomycetota bacterium]|nr:hypothetical protein [Actinomycetota bacterium]